MKDIYIFDDLIDGLCEFQVVLYQEPHQHIT